MIAIAWLITAVPAHAQEDLERTAAALVEAWTGADEDALAVLLDGTGVHVALLDKDHGTLDRRNAGVALERFLQSYPARRAQLVRASEVGGSPDRAFVEIRWTAVAAGTSETVSYTLFADLAQQGQGWRVVELRVLP